MKTYRSIDQLSEIKEILAKPFEERKNDWSKIHQYTIKLEDKTGEDMSIIRKSFYNPDSILKNAPKAS